MGDTLPEILQRRSQEARAVDRPDALSGEALVRSHFMEFAPGFNRTVRPGVGVVGSGK